MNSLVYAQDVGSLLNQSAGLLAAQGSATANLTGGFTFAGIMGSIIFGSIGFVVFVYGKKNAEFRPMIIGALLTIYPYFFRSTLSLYLIGLGLCAFLFFYKE